MQRKLIPVLLVLALCAGLAHAQEPVKAELDKPFALSVEETARVEPDGFEVTLRSMSDDSGCDDPKDCTSYLFKGTLLTRLGEQKQMAQLMVFFKPGAPYTMKFAGYQVEMTSLRRAQKGGPLLATFRVVKAAEEEKKDGNGQ
jgi:hypothetical protein